MSLCLLELVPTTSDTRTFELNVIVFSYYYPLSLLNISLSPFFFVSTVRVAHSGMTTEEIVENIVTAVNTISRKLHQVSWSF